MKYEVIPVNGSIKAGEIRVEQENEGRVSICRYDRDLDPESAELIGQLDLFDYIMQDWYHFLRDIELSILEARVEPENVRIVLSVREWFMME